MTNRHDNRLLRADDGPGGADGDVRGRSGLHRRRRGPARPLSSGRPAGWTDAVPQAAGRPARLARRPRRAVPTPAEPRGPPPGQARPPPTAGRRGARLSPPPAVRPGRRAAPAPARAVTRRPDRLAAALIAGLVVLAPLNADAVFGVLEAGDVLAGLIGGPGTRPARRSEGPAELSGAQWRELAIEPTLRAGPPPAFFARPAAAVDAQAADASIARLARCALAVQGRATVAPYVRHCRG